MSEVWKGRIDMTCALCDEEITALQAWVPLNPEQYAHHCCSLRSVVGGIGHLIAHAWCCLISHDPDAGLTFHQSAVMVAALVDLIGIEGVVKMGMTPLVNGSVNVIEPCEGDDG